MPWVCAMYFQAFCIYDLNEFELVLVVPTPPRASNIVRHEFDRIVHRNCNFYSFCSRC
jgi:hypothetical protein